MNPFHRIFHYHQMTLLLNQQVSYLLIIDLQVGDLDVELLGC